MSKKTLNYVRLGDLVTESFLLREMSPYGCPDEPGRLYGYNPVEKKCVDITGYEGPDRPIAVKPTKFIRKTKADVKDDPGYDLSADGAKELVVDVVGILTSFEKMQKCYDEHPYASMAGLLLGGGGAHYIASKGMIRAAVGLTKGGVKLVAKQTVKTLISPSRLGIIVGAAALYFAFREEDKTVLQNMGRIAYGGSLGELAFPEWAQKVENTMTELDSWTDVNKSNIACFSAAVIGAAATYSMIRYAAVPVAKKMWSVGSVHTKRLGRRLGRALSRSIDELGKGASETSLFLLLKNEVPELTTATVQLVDEGGKSVLKLSGDAQVIKIAASELPQEAVEKFGKFIRDGEIILDPATINRELAELSEDALERTVKNYTDEAGEAVVDGQGKNLQRLMKMLGRGTATEAGALARYFKETGGLFEELIGNSGPQIKALYESALELKKYPNVLGVDEIAMKQIRKAALESGEGGATAVAKLIDDGVITAAAKSDALEFMTKFARQSDAEKTLSVKLESIQRLLKEEAKFAEMFGGAQGTPKLKEFMSIPASSRLKKFQKELGLYLPTLREVGATQTLGSVLKKVFLLGGVAGAAYTASVVSDVLDDTESDLHGKKIIDLSEKFAKTIKAKDYEQGRPPRVTRNVDLLLNNFYKFSRANLQSSPTESNLLKVLEKFVQGAKRSDQVNDYFNNQEEVNIGDDKALQADFLNMIDQEFGLKREKESIPNKQEPEQVAQQSKNLQEVKIMSKENIADLVKQILLENSGKGYSQYPYGSSVKDEEEPKDDYIEDWKSLSLDLIRDESRNTAIEIAKILVKDLELFEDVLDLAGQNQSVGQEILRKLQESKEEA